MRKWIYYCSSWASLIGCLLVASGLESYTGWAMAGCFVGRWCCWRWLWCWRAWAIAPSRKRTKSPARSGSRRKNERMTAERRAEGWADTA